MALSRRRALTLLGGGTIVAATAATGFTVTRMPHTAHEPWSVAGGYDEARRRALSFALLAPNPHNRQPWLVDLSKEGQVILYVDPNRLLPETDPFGRQITIGLGCFLEVMRMAAAADGYRLEINLFPEGSNTESLDDRPVARVRFIEDQAIKTDQLFSHIMSRRSLKEPFETDRAVPDEVLATLATSVIAGTEFGGSVAPDDIATFRRLTREALRIEIETPNTYQESVDLFRIGHREVDANPDGIDFTGPMFESLRLAGLFDRAAATDTTSMAYKAGLDAVFANADTAMGHIWLLTAANTREDQIAAGADWVRVNLAATSIGLGTQPLSQCLQEFPEMSDLYKEVHSHLAPDGGTVQMLARIGYGPSVGPSPRWPLESRIAEGSVS